MRTLLTAVLLSFSIMLNAQVQLCNTSEKVYDLNTFDIQKSLVKCTCADNSEISLPKKEIVYIKTSNNQVITFLSGTKKVVLKEDNIDPAKMATLGKIDAIRFYKTQNRPVITDTEYLQSYNEQLKKLKRGQTVGLVAGGLAFIIGLGSLLGTLGSM